MAPLCRVGRQPASLFGDKARDLAGEAISAVGIAAEGAQVRVPVAGKFCDGAHIAVCPIECRGDREMAQLLRPDRETGLNAEPADDVQSPSCGCRNQA